MLHSIFCTLDFLYGVHRLESACYRVTLFVTFFVTSFVTFFVTYFVTYFETYFVTSFFVSCLLGRLDVGESDPAVLWNRSFKQSSPGDMSVKCAIGLSVATP